MFGPSVPPLFFRKQHRPHLLFVLSLFYFSDMTRITPDLIVLHIEAALTCAPVDTLAALQDTDSQRRRRRATYTLAQHLADRLNYFEITGSGIGSCISLQASLFQEVPRAVR